MNILVTGCNGFLGRNLVDYLDPKYNVFACGRKELDLLNRDKVSEYFSEHRIDMVLHTAIVGGNRINNNTFDSFLANLTMFNNLYENRDKFGKMINF